MYRLQTALPIYAKRSEIIEKIRENPVLLLRGETGSGKSTQIPQYLLEIPEFQKTIACVQPRKLSTITLAERVAYELSVDIPQFVDYQVNMSKPANSQARIKFMLDSVLINEMFSDPTLSKYSCILVDEAHERNINTDLLLGLLKKIRSQSPDLHIIVTSATIDEKLFCDFFGSKMLKVPGRVFPVKIKYLPPNNGQTELDMIADLLCKKVAKIKAKNESRFNGNILVFTAGIDEIETLTRQISNQCSSEYEILPLHGRLGHKD